MNEIVQTLSKVLSSLKKNSKDRVYSDNYVSEKLQKVNQLHLEYLRLNIAFQKPSEEIKEEAEIYEEIIRKLEEIKNRSTQKQIVKEPEEEAVNTEITEEEEEDNDIKSIDEQHMNALTINKNTMASLDLKLAASLVPDFEGQVEKLADFLDAAEFYYSTLDATNKSLLIKFICQVKIKGAAKLALPLSTVISFTDLKDKLTERFGSKKNAASLMRELTGCTQGNATVSEFAAKIEKLTDELSRVQLKDGVNADAVKAINDITAAVNFKKGLSESLKAVVIASRATGFSESVAVACEAEATLEKPEKPQVNFVKENKRGNRGSYRGSNSHARGNRENNRGNFRGGNGNFRGNNRNFRGNNRNFRGNNRNYRGNGYSRRGQAGQVWVTQSQDFLQGNRMAPGPEQQPGALHQIITPHH